ncbi:diguanylate phosphodiesterase [Cupriavidus plantarum]|nr:diguanylate phosphodiesterase [Cupriavidus plantarum]
MFRTWRDVLGGGWTPSPATLLLWLAVCTVSTSAALWAGARVTDDVIAKRERAIASDVVVAITRMMGVVETHGRRRMDGLIGQSCAAIGDALTERQSYIPYLRAAATVADGVAYCSSTRGSIRVPLSWYFGKSFEKGGTAAGGRRIALVGRTPFRDAAPTLVLFEPTDPSDASRGILYLIEGVYVVDALAHGQGFGAGVVALTVGNASIYQDGTFQDGPFREGPAPPGYGTRATSARFPITVAAVADPGFVAATSRKYGLMFGAIGLLAGLLLLTIFLIVAAPRRLLLQAVRQGLKRDQFFVVYQPIVSVRTRQRVGVEALLRWRHPRWGMIPPGSYIETVESTPLIADITRFVMRRVVEDVERYRPAMPMHIAVNVPPLNLRRRGFEAEAAALQTRMPDGAALVLEITERHLLADRGQAMEAFDRLRRAGIRLSVDDFGTRNSNLDLIRSFPFDYLKIDSQFTQSVDDDAKALLASIVAMAHHFRLVVVAEGIETEAQHALLAEIGVDCAQGYLYQRPASAEAVLGAGGAAHAEQDAEPALTVH